MHWYDESNSQHRRLCSAAGTFAQIAEQTIFARITDRTTPEQFRLAQESLRRLCSEFAAMVDWDHYPASSGPGHMCVSELYGAAAACLRHLAIMQPPPPPPSQQLITREGVVIDIEDKPQTSTVETDVGIEDSPFDNWNGR
jgi:hypothetical protein